MKERANKMSDSDSHPFGDLDTQRLRRRMMLYYTRDGLWDICVGVCVLAWALALRFDFVALVGVVIVGAVSVVPAVRQKTTYPRIGYARVKPDSGTRKTLAVLAAFGLAVLMLVLLAGTEALELLLSHIDLALGAMWALLIVVAGTVLAARRFYAYALLVFVGGALTQWGATELWLAFATAGAGIIVAGSAVMLRFVRDNPKAAGEDNG
jgi:hypothetical protein